MEQRFIALRYMALICLVATLPLLDLPILRQAAGYILLLCTATYNVGVQFLLHRRSALLKHGYITTIGDAILCVILVLIGGGFGSDFYFILFLATISAAMRYGYRRAMLVVGLYVVLDALSLTVLDGSAFAVRGDFIFRSSFLAITALLSGFLWEEARSAEQALARQLGRASALNESTRALSASLDMETVIHAVAAEVRRLVGAEAAAVKFGLGTRERVVFGYQTCGEMDAQSQPEYQKVLVTVLQSAIETNGDPFLRGTTDDGCPFLVATLDIRGSDSGMIAVVRAPGSSWYDTADDAILTSFVDRAALAIEKSLLYARLDERSRDLHRAYADLAAAHQELLGVDEMKTNFIANVSHELRTPLTSIRSFSEILLSFDVDIPTRQEFVGIINAESERLTRLINDVLDITKIESGYVEWHMERCDLVDLLKGSARSFASLAHEKSLRFVFQEPSAPVIVKADSDRILQVLANLLSNAVKFTNQGEIAVWAESTADMAYVHISDSGVGIAPADHKKVFEKFHQVGNTLTDKPNGTGLGLCICRDIVEHHGGQIWVESALGAGSCFTFTLPLAGVTTLTDPSTRTYREETLTIATKD